MNLILELPPELESKLVAKAAQLGVPLHEYALHLLECKQGAYPAPRNGAELVAYWQAEGIVGAKPEITDASAHARELREKAQQRVRQ